MIRRASEFEADMQANIIRWKQEVHAFEAACFGEGAGIIRRWIAEAKKVIAGMHGRRN